jgi:peptidoglycan/xylan/chitin deacetylase (PgdA/CDA1 family)
MGMSLNAQSLGDVNKNGSIDIIDALLIAQYFVGLNPQNFDPAYADVNCSGSIDIVDSLLIAQYYVNLISSLPCQSTPAPTSIPTVVPTAAPSATPVTGSCSGANGNVYLCFDDAPSNGNSPTLVNNLVNSGACKATFFIIGSYVSGNQTGWNAIKSAGFSLQNHTQTHQHMTSWSYQQVYDDIQQCTQTIVNNGGAQPHYIRLPYLESTSTIQQACSALGLTIVSPNIDSQDWNGASTQSIISSVSNLSSGQNALQHDFSANTVSAIPTIVQNLKNKGLGFTQY